MKSGSGLGSHSSISENVEHGGVWTGFVDRGSPARSGGGVLLVTGSDVYFDRKLRFLSLATCLSRDAVPICKEARIAERSVARGYCIEENTC